MSVVLPSVLYPSATACGSVSETAVVAWALAEPVAARAHKVLPLDRDRKKKFLRELFMGAVFIVLLLLRAFT